MLINWQYGKPLEGDEAKLLAALGVPDTHHDPVFPLPNLKRCRSSEFWGWNASYSPRARLYFGHQTVDGERGAALGYWMGDTKPSFLVLVIYKNTVAHHPIYFRWTGCEHDWKIERSGNCWRDYRCSKCKAEYHEDSSG